MKKITLFKNVEQYLQDLEEILPEEDIFLTNKVTQYGVSMIMMNIINACIDIGNELITIRKFSYPTTYRETFTILEKQKIISSSLTKKMKNLVGLRNLLAHEYGEINMELLYEQAIETRFIEEFLKKTITYFK